MLVAMKFFIQFFKNRATSGQIQRSFASEEEAKAWADEHCATGNADDFVILIDVDVDATPDG